MTKDIQHQAREYASDCIPTYRSAEGFGLFHRASIVGAYIDGANWQKAQTAPLALVPPAAEERQDWKSSPKPTELFGRAIAKQLQDLRDGIARNNEAHLAANVERFEAIAESLRSFDFNQRENFKCLLAEIRDGAKANALNFELLHNTLLARAQPASELDKAYEESQRAAMQPLHPIPMRPDIESIPDESGQGSGMGVTPAPSTQTQGISRELMGLIVDEVFDGAIEDARVIEEIYAVIKRHEAGPQEHKPLLTCQCANSKTDPCIVCGKGKTLVTAEWMAKMAAREGDHDATTGCPSPKARARASEPDGIPGEGEV